MDYINYKAYFINKEVLELTEFHLNDLKYIEVIE